MNEALGRFYLEDAIGKAKARNARRIAERLKQGAGHARDGAADLIAHHPFTAVAGGVVLGVLIGTLLPRRRLAQGASSIVGLVARAGHDYWREALTIALAARHGNTTAEADVVELEGTEPEAIRPKRKLLGRFAR